MRGSAPQGFFSRPYPLGINGPFFKSPLESGSRKPPDAVHIRRLSLFDRLEMVRGYGRR